MSQKLIIHIKERDLCVSDVRFTALRHTTATRLIDKGIDLYTGKEWLGHSTIQVTERYAHLNPFGAFLRCSILPPPLRESVAVQPTATLILPARAVETGFLFFRI